MKARLFFLAEHVLPLSGLAFWIVVGCLVGYFFPQEGLAAWKSFLAGGLAGSIVGTLDAGLG